MILWGGVLVLNNIVIARSSIGIEGSSVGIVVKVKHGTIGTSLGTV